MCVRENEKKSERKRVNDKSVERSFETIMEKVGVGCEGEIGGRRRLVGEREGERERGRGDKGEAELTSISTHQF